VKTNFDYAHRYECQDNILLFPFVEGVSKKSYVIEGNYCSHRIRVEFVKLNCDLRSEGPTLREEIGKALGLSIAA